MMFLKAPWTVSWLSCHWHLHEWRRNNQVSVQDFELILFKLVKKQSVEFSSLFLRWVSNFPREHRFLFPFLIPCILFFATTSSPLCHFLIHPHPRPDILLPPVPLCFPTSSVNSSIFLLHSLRPPPTISSRPPKLLLFFSRFLHLLLFLSPLSPTPFFTHSSFL